MPCGPYSMASERVRASTAPFDAAYADRRGVPTCEDTDDTLITEPRPCSTICGTSAVVSSSRLRTLSWWMRSIVEPSSSVESVRTPSAALLTSTSTRPSAASAAAATVVGASGSARSTAITTGSCSRPAATAARSSAERATRATRAPAASRAVAIAAPMPRDAPVTTAVRSSSEKASTPGPYDPPAAVGRPAAQPGSGRDRAAVSGRIRPEPTSEGRRGPAGPAAAGQRSGRVVR